MQNSDNKSKLYVWHVVTQSFSSDKMTGRETGTPYCGPQRAQLCLRPNPP